MTKSWLLMLRILIPYQICMWISNFAGCVKPDILQNKLFFPKPFYILNKILYKLLKSN